LITTCHGAVRGAAGDALDRAQSRIHRFAELAEHDQAVGRHLAAVAAVAVEDGDGPGGVGEAEHAPGGGRRLVPQGDRDALADGVVGEAHRLGQVAVEHEAEPAGAAEQFHLPRDPGPQCLVVDLSDRLIEDVGLVAHVAPARLATR